MKFKVKPLAGALGAEIVGLDMSKPIDDATQAEIRAAWLQHLVLLFRGQDLTPAQLIGFSRRFAQPHVHDNYEAELRHPEHPEVLLVKSRAVAGREVRFGEQWHSDMSFTTRPALASVLYAQAACRRSAATRSGPNMYLAFETLSPADAALPGIAGGHPRHQPRHHPPVRPLATDRGEPPPQPAGAPAGGAGASRDRSQGPLRQRMGLSPLHRHDGGREPTHPADAVRAFDAAGLPVPAEVAARRPSHLGQPLHDPPGAQGLRGLRIPRVAAHLAGRRALGSAADQRRVPRPPA